MVDSNFADLLAEISLKRKQTVWWPIVASMSFLAALILVCSGVAGWISLPVIALLVVFTVLVQQRDQLKKSVVLMYDLEDQMLAAYQNLFESIRLLTECGGVWHISGKGQVYDGRYHAGAGSLINRSRVAIGFRDPPYVKTNVSVPCLPFGNLSLYLLPDCVLAFASNDTGAVDYASLELAASPTRFIEDGQVPSDAKIVDHTWRFVNKNGSPDRRFNNNRQIPICQYEELRISSTTGVSEVLQISRLGASVPVDHAITGIARSIVDAENAERTRMALESERLEREKRQVQNTPPPLPIQKPVSPKRPPAQTLHHALFRLLCCVMVADGRVSRTEREKIMAVMKRMKSGWSDEKCHQRIDSFIGDVKSMGFASVLDRAIDESKIFCGTGHESIVLKCLDEVAQADGVLHERESELLTRIRASVLSLPET